MRSSKEIKKEIESRFGFFPPFFAPALKTPRILENLWQQTLSAYVENPLPALFKEQFAAIVARSCSVPYCLVCHSCALRPLGMKAGDVLDLLEKWHVPSESDIRASLSLLAGYTGKIGNWPEAGSTFEDAILHISVQIFFGDDETESYSKALRGVIGDTNYAFLTLFFAYNKTCLTWAEAHANELSFEADQRAKEHLGPLLAEEPRLGEFFKNYKEKFSNTAKSKLAKQMSVESETKYKKLVQLSPAGIFQADKTGKFVFVSEGWQRVAGLSLEEAINAGWENAVHPDDKEKIFKEWMSSDAEKRTFKCEYRLRKPSGEITWVNAECEQLRNVSGEITGYLGALLDITNIKDYEERLVLAQSELESRVEERTADLLSLTESIPQLVWKIAPNGKSLYMSPNWTELTGVPSVQAHWGNIIHPEDVPASKNAWLKCLETGSSYETEYRIKRKDGSYRWFLARGVPQLDSDGKVKNWFGTCTDIHDQKIAIQSNMRMAAIVESSNDAIIGKDLTGIVTSWNPAAEKIFGYRSEEMIGKSILKLFPEDRVSEEASILDRLQRGIQIRQFETERIRKDGTRFPVFLSMSPIYDDNKMVVGIAKTARDITHEKQAHLSLVEQTKNLADLQSRFQK
ncbi:MAG: PAS domain-containing protein, partial [Bdellovibrionia bacterium]